MAPGIVPGIGVRLPKLQITKLCALGSVAAAKHGQWVHSKPGYLVALPSVACWCGVIVMGVGSQICPLQHFVVWRVGCVQLAAWCVGVAGALGGVAGEVRGAGGWGADCTGWWTSCPPFLGAVAVII